MKILSALSRRIVKSLRFIALTLCTIAYTSAVSAETGASAIADTVITSKIKYKIASEVKLAPNGLSITTRNGNVAIVGTVDTDDQAVRVVNIAETTPGVNEVNTRQLNVVNSVQPLTDTLITAKVKGIFFREKLINSLDIAAVGISVETKNGVVYLTGKADNTAQIHNAITIAKSIDDVRSVVSRIEVST